MKQKLKTILDNMHEYNAGKENHSRFDFSNCKRALAEIGDNKAPKEDKQW